MTTFARNHHFCQNRQRIALRIAKNHQNRQFAQYPTWVHHLGTLSGTTLPYHHPGYTLPCTTLPVHHHMLGTVSVTGGADTDPGCLGAVLAICPL